MEYGTCDQCGASLILCRRGARFCSARCRVAAHRARRRLPAELTARARWVRHTAAKVPLTVTGTPASSTDPATWSAYEAAVSSTVGVGLGFVLNGDGICCIDVDHCIENGALDPRVINLIDATPGVFYIELSPSGTGIHIWHHGHTGKGTRRIENGLHVERYGTGRYMTVTGRWLDV